MIKKSDKVIEVSYPDEDPIILSGRHYREKKENTENINSDFSLFAENQRQIYKTPVLWPGSSEKAIACFLGYAVVICLYNKIIYTAFYFVCSFFSSELHIAPSFIRGFYENSMLISGASFKLTEWIQDLIFTETIYENNFAIFIVIRSLTSGIVSAAISLILVKLATLLRWGIPLVTDRSGEKISWRKVVFIHSIISTIIFLMVLMITLIR